MKIGNVEISEKSLEIIVKSIVEKTLGENMEDRGLADNFDLDCLAKIEDVGKYASEKAMKFITDMTGYNSELKVFNIRLATPEEIKEEFGEDEKIITKINFNGDIKGTGVLIFSRDSALNLSRAMLAGMGMEAEGDEFDEMKISAINEICNILISAYVDSFANFMKTSLTMSPPEFCEGKGNELLDKIFNENNIKNDDIIMAFKSSLYVCDVGAGFDVLIVLPNESVSKLFEVIRKGEINDKLSVKYDN
ncbi:chemotaxis protein CheC [Methanocaldococcus indicus]|uniref:chemotaxis protein CheC n=1 Tax=Methanocaldococcus indicus TaxID=213231 RepID=UPI003C6D5F3C